MMTETARTHRRYQRKTKDTTMRMLVFFFSMTLLAGSVRAQTYAGTFTAQTASGVTTLTLQQDAYGEYIGLFVNEQGVEFEVEGTADEKALSGYIANEKGEVSFAASFEGENLALYLIPFNADGEPQYDAGKEYVLARQPDAGSGQANLPTQQAPPGNMMNKAPLAGTYSGMLNGTPTTLTLQEQGASFQGEAVAGGYRYVLSGTVRGNTATGTLSDPQAGGTMNVELVMQGDQLTLILLVQDPNTRQINRIPAQFQRGTAAQPGMGTGSGMGAGPAAEENVERDPALIGAWSYTDSMTSGDASMVTQQFLQINAEGTYAIGNGRAVGGGAGWSADTGSGGDVARGQWRTLERIVYVKENGVGQWTPYARYYVEGSRMMLTFADGSRQIWYRR